VLSIIIVLPEEGKRLSKLLKINTQMSKTPPDIFGNPHVGLAELGFKRRQVNSRKKHS
jgi:hypothetical protein